MYNYNTIKKTTKIFDFVYICVRDIFTYSEPTMSADKLELKITEDAQGREVDLSNMTLKESHSLITLLEALTNIIEQSVVSDNIKIQVVKGSASVIAAGSTKEISSLKIGFEEVISNKSANKELVENWRKIQNLFWANGLEYQASFYQDGQKQPIIDRIKTSRTFRTKFTRTEASYKLSFIEGKLIEIGGKNPNIHVIGKKGNKITINCSEGEARKVNSLLYQPIKISVWSKVTSTPHYTFCDNYINDAIYKDFKDFISSELNYDKYLNDLHYKLKSYLDNKDFGTLKKFLRLFNHISTESSTLKTILIITKSFRDNDELKSIRVTLKELLEKKKGNKLI